MRISAISVLLIFLFNTTYGTDLSTDKYFTDSEGYNCVKQGDTGLEYSCLNYNKIKKIGSGKRMTWSKFIFNTPQTTSTSYQTFYSYVSLDIYDCINDTQATYQQNYYDINGHVVTSWQARSIKLVEYSYNAPGTIGDDMQAVVCSKK